MSTISQHDEQNNNHKSRLYLASLLLIIGTLMPTMDFEQDNLIWFWQWLTYSKSRGYLTFAFLHICGFLTIFIPLILCRSLPARSLSIGILVTMVLFGIMSSLPFILQATSLGIRVAPNNSFPSSLSLIGFYSLILLGVGSRLTIMFPLKKFPLIMMRIASILLLLLVSIIIYSKIGENSYASKLIDMFIFADAWTKDPIIIIFSTALTLLFLFSLMSSFQKNSAEKIAMVIYILVGLAGIIFLQTASYSFTGPNIFYFIALVKILILGFAYISLISCSLYSSCYLFTKK